MDRNTISCLLAHQHGQLSDDHGAVLVESAVKLESVQWCVVDATAIHV